MASKIKAKKMVIGGMTCAACQSKIQRRLQSTAGVKSASVSYRDGTAEVTYDEGVVTLLELIIVIEKLDYSVLRGQAARETNVSRTLIILAAIAALYFLLRYFDVLTLLVPSQLADMGMGYGMLFVIGLLTSIHCIAMCDGINLSQSLPRADASAESDQKHMKAFIPALLYNLGRVISYTVIGFILGFAVSFLVTFLRNANFFVFRMRGGLRVAAGALVKREVFFSESSLNMIRFEQRPLAKLFGRFSVKVCVAGYGKESKESAVIIPCDTGKACRDLVAGLLPSFKMEPLFLRIPRYAVWRTLIPYILLLGADIALAVTGTVLLPTFRRLIVIFAAGFFALLLLSLLVALRTWRVGGLTLGDQVEACAGTFFTSFRIKTGEHKVGVIRVMRTPLDIPENFCAVRVTVRSEKAWSCISDYGISGKTPGREIGMRIQKCSGNCSRGAASVRSPRRPRERCSGTMSRTTVCTIFGCSGTTAIRTGKTLRCGSTNRSGGCST